MCAGGQKHLIYAERESHKAISLAAGERGHFGRMEVEARLTVIDFIWGCCWLASLFFGGVGCGGEICQDGFSATEKTKTGNQTGEVITEGVGGIKRVQPVTGRKEKYESEYFESARFKTLIYSQCVSMRFHRFLPPCFPFNQPCFCCIIRNFSVSLSCDFTAKSLQFSSPPCLARQALFLHIFS